jgi:hypothetical protein
MKNKIAGFVGLAMMLSLFAGAISAQTEAISAAAGDKYVISAKAGGVNYVAGDVTVTRPEGSSGRLLKGDRLEIGERVSTNSLGRAEILLNPGSYLRVGPSSVVEFESTNLDDLRIKVLTGSAIFEVFATEDFVVRVVTPKNEVQLIDSGVYRIDAEPGSSRVSVWKGKARFSGDVSTLIKSGREAVISGAQAAVSKFDRGDLDELEVWSKDRAKELARLTGKLQRDNMRTALMRSFLGRQWNMYSSFGLWVYDPFRATHCFLPFGFGWGSPYGYGFGQNIWYYNLPTVVYNPPTGGGVSAANTVRSVKPGRRQDDVVVRPPFAQVQGTSGATGRDFSTVKSGNIDTGSSFEPVRPSGGFMTGSSSGGGVTSSAPAGVQATKPGRPQE